MTRAAPWGITRVEVVDPTSTTELVGGALLLGAGVTAFASNGEHTAVLDIDVVDGRFVCTSVRVTGHRVRPDTLRAVPIGRLLRSAFDSLDDADWRPQRATTPSDRIAGVIACWLSLQGGRDAHRATTVTAQRMCLSRGHTSRLLSQARADGLLPR